MAQRREFRNEPVAVFREWRGDEYRRHVDNDDKYGDRRHGKLAIERRRNEWQSNGWQSNG